MYQNPELNIEQEVFDLLFTDKDCSPIKTPYILKSTEEEKTTIIE